MTLLIIIHVFICVFLVFVILLQPGKGDAGIGFGSSSSQSIFGSKGAGNFLTKTTSVCAICFLVTSFFLTRSRIMEYSGSVIKGGTPANASPAPGVPTIPSKVGDKPGAAKDDKGAAKPATPAPVHKDDEE